jgi:radical SAM protein with 4Fe4S-binding SPASM domain
VDELAQFIELSTEETIEIIKPFIENKEEFHTQLEGANFNIPKNLIIQHPHSNREYFDHEFDYEETDFKTKRLFVAPVSITLMLTNKCVTNCLYCYADTKHQVNNLLNIEHIKSLIHQAYKLNVNSFELIGGEVFLYPQWKEVFEELVKYEFHPNIISTKVPLTEGDILFLKKLNLTKVQISLDSVVESELKLLIRRDINYLNAIAETLRLLDKHQFKVQIAVTVTKHNASKDSVNKLLNFLDAFKSIENIDFGPAFYSLYKKSENFEKWGVSVNQYNDLIDFTDEIEEQHAYYIQFDESYTTKKYYSCKSGSSNFDGAACSANRDHMFILPDGKVTICEQLYWNHEFIVGDIREQSIEEVWKSERSLFLAHLSQNDISNQSACKTCAIFDDCHTNVNKCWADIIKAYGTENWDFPDPRCTYAPKMTNSISFKEFSLKSVV